MVRRRGAFTLIELIFAIVVIGLVSITIPLILVNNSRNVEQNLVQEGILVASTKMGQILTYPWDENSRDPNSTVLAKTAVLDTAGDTDLNRSVSDYRVGHFQEMLRRKMTPINVPRAATNTTALGSDANDTDDIDDFNNTTEAIMSAGVDEYKQDYTISISVAYVSDTADYSVESIGPFNFDTGAAGGTTNIKMISVGVAAQDPAGNWVDTVLLRSYSANIGETDFYKRNY